MNKNVKWFAAPMAFTLAFGSMLAACASSDTGKAGETAKTPSSQPAAPTAPAEKPEISVTIYDRGNTPAAEGTPEDNRWTRWINENAPVKVKFVPIPRQEAAQKVNVLFASGSAPDLIFEYDTNLKSTLIAQKQVLPLNDLIEKHSVEYKEILKKFPALKAASITEDGKIYQFGKIAEAVPRRGVFIRNDWLNKLGLKAPTTDQEMLEVAKAFVEKDPDGNGQKDTFGIALSHQGMSAVFDFFGANDFHLSNGKVEFAWENFRAALKFKEAAFDAGLVDKDFLADKNGAKAKQAFLSGKLGIFPTFPGWGGVGNDLETLQKNVPGATFTMIETPKTSMGAFNPYYQNPIQLTAFVNAKAKNPEAVMKYVDWLMKPEVQTTLAFGIKGEHHELNQAGCPQKINLDRFKNEIDYMQDALRMLEFTPLALTGKCGMLDQFNTQDPVSKFTHDNLKQAMDLYWNPDKPYASIFVDGHYPQLPKDMTLAYAELYDKAKRQGVLYDIFAKATVDKNYNADQAIEDAKAAWKKSGGEDIEKYLTDWYAKNKDQAFLPKSLYEVVAEQKKYTANH